MESVTGPRIAVITGSLREDNYTGKAAALVLDELRRREVAHDLIDPATVDFRPTGAASTTPETVVQARELVRAATGVILATPEYHGSYSATMKTVIDNLGFPSVLSGKPVVLLGVAAGRIGAIKALEHLASVCQHVGSLVLPGPVSVASVRTVFDETGRCTDPAIEKRIRGLAGSLMNYIERHICPLHALEEMVRED